MNGKYAARLLNRITGVSRRIHSMLLTELTGMFVLTIFVCIVTVDVLAQTQAPRDEAFFIYQDIGMANTNHFVPSGIMGDVGDIVVNEGWTEKPYAGKTSIRIQYDPKGKGPNGCDYSPPCGWAGVYWLEPANNWGTEEKLKDAGYDLSEYNVLRFWARTDTKCKDGACKVTFTVGGIDKRYGDSLRSGRKTEAPLTGKWSQFEIDLKKANLRHIIGGFSFGVAQRDFPQGIVLYLDDIRFEKK